MVDVVVAVVVACCVLLLCYLLPGTWCLTFCVVRATNSIVLVGIICRRKVPGGAPPPALLAELVI